MTQEVVDFGFAFGLAGRVEFAELAEELIGFEVDAFDFVIVATALDGGPFDDRGGGGAEGVTHIGLLKDFVGTGASTAIGEELRGRDGSVAGAVDDIEEAEFDGVGHGDAEVEIPGRGGIFGF